MRRALAARRSPAPSTSSRTSDFSFASAASSGSTRTDRGRDTGRHPMRTARPCPSACSASCLAGCGQPPCPTMRCSTRSTASARSRRWSGDYPAGTWQRPRSVGNWARCSPSSVQRSIVESASLISNCNHYKVNMLNLYQTDLFSRYFLSAGWQRLVLVQGF